MDTPSSKKTEYSSHENSALGTSGIGSPSALMDPPSMGSYEGCDFRRSSVRTRSMVSDGQGNGSDSFKYSRERIGVTV